MSTPNRLAGQTSPYLLQHVNNPVDWQPWSTDALAQAKQTDKPIIVSIGYSACHWCHVMERESFENEAIAKIMNANFVCIKVDREERADIDQIYMEAVQLMGIHGGWPLNVFLMPDGRPFYGGTYYTQTQWQNLLLNIANAFENHRTELDKSANEFTKSLQIQEVQKYGLDQNIISKKYNLIDIEQLENQISADFDLEKGGSKGAPKFPMPSVYVFLLRAWHHTKQHSGLKHTENTLLQMCYGGIYDQIGGGFSRYSTDANWFAPHFEKMLYDNGQLLSLYAEAFVATKNPVFEQIITQTAHFVSRELTSPEFGFYAALDADSEGVEGLFYVWKYQQIQNLISNHADFLLFVDYYNIHPEGNWEHGHNILFKHTDDKIFAHQNGLSESELYQKIRQLQSVLLNERKNRIRPGLDDKILAGWNGLMLKGLADAYRVSDDIFMLELAQKNAEFILSKLWDGQILFRSYKNNIAKINGFCEDYAYVIEGLIALYQADFQEKWLLAAQEITNRAIALFYDEEDDLFFYTDRQDEQLIANKKEIFDNVISSSNAAMAHNLFSLSMFFDGQQAQEYAQIAKRMLDRVWPLLTQNPRYMSYWAALATRFVSQNYQLAIVGPDYLKFRKIFDQYYMPNKIIVGTDTISKLPLLQNRESKDLQTLIHVCEESFCHLPVGQVSEALDIIQKEKK